MQRLKIVSTEFFHEVLILTIIETHIISHKDVFNLTSLEGKKVTNVIFRFQSISLIITFCCKYIE